MKYNFIFWLSFVLLVVPEIQFAQIQSYPLSNVSLKSGPFKNAQEVDFGYIMKLNPDKLLAPYLIDAGLPLKAERYGNWENIGLDGHIAGHYLSALAMLYSSTGNKVLKKRLQYMISELETCQQKNGNGYVGGIPEGKVFWERINKGDIDGSSFGLNNTWVPLYNIHKLYKGLYDAYIYAENKQAKSILIKLGDWFIKLIEPLSDKQIQQILKTEHGGINEAFADLYSLTNDEKYLTTAIRLSHIDILNPLINREDKLTGLHANTQIPKVIGFERIAGLNNNHTWSEAARYFWSLVSETRSVAFGGNSVREHFNPAKDFSKVLESNQGPETCNSYNMLRLSKALFENTGEIKYLEFYERTLFNHILSSQHPEKGGFVYFTPIRPNHYRVYSQPHTSMWCCVGSGLENHTKYGELIYSFKQEDLFVNLFIASKLYWKEQNVQIEQITDFPKSNQSEIIVKLRKPQKFTIHLRFPSWASEYGVNINGKPFTDFEKAVNGYVSISRLWNKNDQISINFNPSTSLERLPDGSNWGAFLYGPLVLAAKTSNTDLKGLFADDSRMGHEAKGKMYSMYDAHVLVSDNNDHVGKLKPINNQKFKLDSLIMEPFYEVHDARYQMYFPLLTTKEYAAQQLELQTKEQDFLAKEAITIDKINCGEQQPETDHRYKGEKSNNGYDDESFWRNTRSFISYTLTDSYNKAKYLEISALDKIDLENISIILNNQEMTNIMVDKSQLKIKLDLSDKEIQLVIKVKENKVSPRFTEIRLLSQ
jgi:uncharacterized protein